MAEQLEIKVGADLEAASKAFEKLHADIDKAMKGGQQSFQKFVQTYQTQVPKLTKGTADATNALTNFSRIAQDAPYGLMGIANNINPALESFQRLQKEAGGTGNALKALVAGMTGPAGVGLAIGVVSSLLVAFGDKLFSAGESAKYLGDDLKLMASQADATKKSIEDLGDEIAFLNKAAGLGIRLKGGTDVDVLNREIERFKFNVQDIDENVLPGLRRDLAELASRDMETLDTTDEGKQVLEAIKAKKEAFDAAIKQQSEFRKNIILLEGQAQLEQKKLNEEAQKEEQAKNKKLAAERKRAFDEWAKLMEKYRRIVAQNKLDQRSTDIAPIPEIKDDSKQIISSYLLGLRHELESKGDNEKIPLSDLFAGEAAFKEFVKNGGQTATQLQEQQIEKARNLADTISGTVTPAFQGMFDAILEGKNAVQGFFNGIAQGLKSLLSRMAAALVQALALKAVFSLLFPGSNIAKSSIGSLFKGIMGFADGGSPPVGRASIIGERGPELFVPKTSGIIIPNHALKGVLGGGGGYQLSVSELRLSGKDLIAAIAVNQKAQGRRF
ncbi:MAG TPA: hypothetical protein VFT06_00240 [Flavisolibacter sp.]|nr:hypothetical protein [Flavisolibacter sp.]